MKIRCPRCKGSGREPFSRKVCSVCKGARVVEDLEKKNPGSKKLKMDNPHNLRLGKPCPSCGEKITSISHIGQVVTCPSCGAKARVTRDKDMFRRNPDFADRPVEGAAISYSKKQQKYIRKRSMSMLTKGLSPKLAKQVRRAMGYKNPDEKDNNYAVQSDDREERLAIARTIWSQLGGGKFVAMTGAKDMVALKSGLQFKLPANFAGNKANKVVIELNGDDTYTIQFWRIGNATKANMYTPKIEKLSEHKGIYNDMLQDIFTKETGLHTHLNPRSEKRWSGKSIHNPRVEVDECPKCHRKKGERHLALGKMPSIETMLKWEEAGKGKATDGCSVEPDGVCQHGHNSWLRVSRLI